MKSCAIAAASTPTHACDWPITALQQRLAANSSPGFREWCRSAPSSSSRRCALAGAACSSAHSPWVSRGTRGGNAKTSTTSSRRSRCGAGWPVPSAVPSAPLTDAMRDHDAGLPRAFSLQADSAEQAVRLFVQFAGCARSVRCSGWLVRARALPCHHATAPPSCPCGQAASVRQVHARVQHHYWSGFGRHQAHPQRQDVRGGHYHRQVPTDPEA